MLNSMMVRPFWKAATWFGMRRLCHFLPGASYANTIFYFRWSSEDTPMVALTIDDGLVRGDNSMVSDVLDLLDEFQAKATFFVCTDYVDQEDALHVLQRGHELGNHLKEDVSGYYPRLTREDFAQAVQEANGVLEKMEQTAMNAEHDNSKKKPNKIRWFRAPQGVLTPTMRHVIEDDNMRSVLGDCYCDDWRYAQALDRHNGNHNNEQDRFQSMEHVAKLMLQQAQPGSIAIFHMPERGFREGTLWALRLFLQGLQDKGWKCCCLTEMAHLIESDSFG